MSVSDPVGASLAARRGWCRPDEPIRWALRTHGMEFRVDGLDSNGIRKPGLGKKLSGMAGQAGMAVAVGALTVAFGGGEGDSRSESGSRNTPRRDLTVFGPGPRCTAVNLVRSALPAGCTASDSSWVLTPNRLAVLLPVGELRSHDTGPGGWRQLGHGWGDVGRVLVGAKSEEFGRNVPGGEMRAEGVRPWFELGRGEISEFRAVDLGGILRSQCALILPDGSGVALDARLPTEAEMMATAGNTFLRGR